MENIKKENSKEDLKVDPGNVIAGQYVPDPSTSQGKVIVGKYSLYIPTNPNIIIS